jgi:hypothetical protein
MPDELVMFLMSITKLCTFTSIDYLGCVASACVLLTFCMQSMFRLRLAALLSNISFIAYGWLGGLLPILILHCVLVLINSMGLISAIRNGRSTA